MYVLSVNGELKQMAKIFEKLHIGNPNKPDFTEKDLPETRLELFWDALKLNFWKMIMANALYSVCLIPLTIWVFIYVVSLINSITGGLMFFDVFNNSLVANNMQVASVWDHVTPLLVIATPLIMIGGPTKAGMYYVCRNWARGESAQVGADFRHGIKINWKQSLFFEFLTGFVLVCITVAFTFYGDLAKTNGIWYIAQYFALAVGIVYFMMSIYFYPLAVTYEFKIKQVLKNSFIFTIVQFPMTLVITLVPIALILLSLIFGNPLIGIALMYLVGFAFVALVQLSFSNKLFDKYINPKVEGAELRRGMRKKKGAKK